MNYEDIEIGQRIVINGDLTNTRRYFGVITPMEEMVGRILIAENKYYNDKGTPLVSINDYNWHPEDVESADKFLDDKPEQMYHYNIKELVI